MVCTMELEDFLLYNRPPQPLHQKTVNSPSGKSTVFSYILSFFNFYFFAKNFINTYQFYAEYEYLCCNFQFFWCREGRCNSDIAVFWILSVWEGCSRFCQDQSGFFCFCYDCFCTSIQRISSPPSSLSSTLNTVSNFGLKISACFFIC